MWNIKHMTYSMGLAAIVFLFSLVGCSSGSSEADSEAQEETRIAAALNATLAAMQQPTNAAPGAVISSGTPLALTPTEPPLNTRTPTSVPTATRKPYTTPGGPTFTANGSVFCRYGPSQAFDYRTSLDKGESATVIGKSDTSVWRLWWFVNYKSMQCWVSDGFGTLTGDYNNVPVVAVATPMP